MPFALETANHQIMTLAGRLHQLGNLLRGILQVVVHRYNISSPGFAETAEVGAMLAIISQQIDRQHIGEGSRQLGDNAPTVVFASVINQDDFVRRPLCKKELAHLGNGLCYDSRAVKNGDNYAELYLNCVTLIKVLPPF